MDMSVSNDAGRIVHDITVVWVSDWERPFQWFYVVLDASAAEAPEESLLDEKHSPNNSTRKWLTSHIEPCSPDSSPLAFMVWNLHSCHILVC